MSDCFEDWRQCDSCNKSYPLGGGEGGTCSRCEKYMEKAE